jgi:putative membrane protein
MTGFILRMLIIMVGLWLASALLPGVTITGTGTFVLAALLLAFVNAVVRPVVLLLTIPITLVTLGLFILVINAAMFGLVAAFLERFYVAGFWSALFGWLIVSLTSTVASWYIGPRGRYELMVVERRSQRR